MRKLRLLAVATAMFIAATANAGALLSATFITNVQGIPLALGTVTGGTPTGTLIGNTFSLDAGNAFAVAFCIGNPGNLACIAAPAPFAPPVTRLAVSFTMNGPLVGTTGDPTITAPSGVMGAVLVKAKIGKAPAFTLVPVIVNAGAGTNLTTPPITGTTTTSMGGMFPIPSATLRVQLLGDEWHIGAVTQTGLTSMFLALPDVTAAGNVSVTSMGNTHVNLVSLGRTKIRGLANSDTSSPTFLQLVYAPSVPEPGTLMLLGAGVAGLVLIGRRKLQ